MSEIFLISKKQNQEKFWLRNNYEAYMHKAALISHKSESRDNWTADLCPVLVESVGGVHEVVAGEGLEGLGAPVGGGAARVAGVMLLLVKNAPPQILKNGKIIL